MQTEFKYIQQIKQIEQRLMKLFKNESTGHDWFHTSRVSKLSMHIAKDYNVNLDVVCLGALLHDVSDHKFNGGDLEKGGQIAKKWMDELNIDAVVQLNVLHIVNNISYKGAQVENKISSLEGKIVQDADRLEAIGAIGIARTFAFGGFVGQPIYDPEVKPTLHNNFEAYSKERTHTINHFYEKLLLLKDKMHTSKGKEIAEERHQLMENFLKEFYKEWEVNL